MGRRQGGVGETSPLCFFPRVQSEDASPASHGRRPFSSQPSGPEPGFSFCGNKLVPIPGSAFPIKGEFLSFQQPETEFSLEKCHLYMRGTSGAYYHFVPQWSKTSGNRN